MNSPIPNNLIPLLDTIPEKYREQVKTGWSQPRSIVSFRVNYLKSTLSEVIKALESASLPYSVWNKHEDIFYLPKEEYEYSLRGLDIYKNGKIYVQSLSSMIPSLSLDLRPHQKILDMTAAPGSKTTQIASILRGECQITALEKFGVRYDKLIHTLQNQ